MVTPRDYLNIGSSINQHKPVDAQNESEVTRSNCLKKAGIFERKVVAKIHGKTTSISRTDAIEYLQMKHINDPMYQKLSSSYFNSQMITRLLEKDINQMELYQASTEMAAFVNNITIKNDNARFEGITLENGVLHVKMKQPAIANEFEKKLLTALNKDPDKDKTITGIVFYESDPNKTAMFQEFLNKWIETQETISQEQTTDQAADKEVPITGRLDIKHFMGAGKVKDSLVTSLTEPGTKKTGKAGYIRIASGKNKEKYVKIASGDKEVPVIIKSLSGYLKIAATNEAEQELQDTLRVASNRGKVQSRLKMLVSIPKELNDTNDPFKYGGDGDNSGNTLTRVNKELIVRTGPVGCDICIKLSENKASGEKIKELLHAAMKSCDKRGITPTKICIYGEIGKATFTEVIKEWTRDEFKKFITTDYANFKDAQGVSLLEHAYENEMYDIVDILCLKEARLENGRTPLHQAVIAGDTEIATKYLDKYFNDMDEYGMTALDYAILGEQTEIAKAILNKMDGKELLPRTTENIDKIKSAIQAKHISYPDPKKLTARLLMAIEKQDVRTIDLLINFASEKDIEDIKAFGKYDEMVKNAIVKGNNDLVNLLNRISPIDFSKFNAVLLDEIEKNDINCVRLLIERGTTININDKKFLGLLENLIDDKSERAKLLVELLVNTKNMHNILFKNKQNDKNELSAFELIREKNPELHAKLVKAENTEKLPGKLHEILLSAPPKVVESLISRDILNALAFKDGKTPMSIIRARANNNEAGFKELYEKLLGNDPLQTDANYKDTKTGKTTLHYAIETGDVDLARRLYAPKSANIKDSNGTSLLHYACEYGMDDIANDLMDNHKNDINLKNKNGQTPLHFSARYNNEKAVGIVTLLLANGAKINEQDHEGNTPLHYACLIGTDVAEKNPLLRIQQSNIKETGSVVLKLLENGANPNIRNKQAQTPNAPRNGTRDMLVDIFSSNSYGYRINHFINACKKGNLEIINALLSTNVKIQIKADILTELTGRQAMNALFDIGISNINNIKNVGDLIIRAKSTDINIRKTILNENCEDGNLENVRMLIEKGIIEITDLTPADRTIILKSAIKSGNLELVNLLKSKGLNKEYVKFYDFFNVDHQKTGFKELETLFRSGLISINDIPKESKVGMLKVFIMSGNEYLTDQLNNVKLTASDLTSLLEEAIEVNNLKAVPLLQKQGVDIALALGKALVNGTADMIRLLTSEDDSSKTFEVEKVVKGGNVKVTKTIREHIKDRLDDKSTNPTEKQKFAELYYDYSKDMFLEFCAQGDIDNINILISEKILTQVPWEKAQEDFFNGIMNAINSGNQQVFDMLMDMPQNLHFGKKFDFTKYGTKLFDAAMQKNNMYFIRKLLEKGCIPDVENKTFNKYLAELILKGEINLVEKIITPENINKIKFGTVPAFQFIKNYNQRISDNPFNNLIAKLENARLIEALRSDKPGERSDFNEILDYIKFLIDNGKSEQVLPLITSKNIHKIKFGDISLPKYCSDLDIKLEDSLMAKLKNDQFIAGMATKDANNIRDVLKLGFRPDLNNPEFLKHLRVLIHEGHADIVELLVTIKTVEKITFASEQTALELIKQVNAQLNNHPFNSMISKLENDQLISAMESGSTVKIRSMMKTGFKPDITNDTFLELLMDLIEKDKDDIVELLVTPDNCKEIKLKNGKTLLKFIEEHNRYSTKKVKPFENLLKKLQPPAAGPMA